MKIWTAMRRLNQTCDAWATRAAAKMIDDLDRRGADNKNPRVKKHIGVWDLLSNRRDPIR